MVVLGGVNIADCDRLVKSNILYIDGRNLHRSRMLDYHPVGRIDKIAAQGEYKHAEQKNNSLLSRYVREILVFLCRMDSRYYASKLGVPPQSYQESLLDYYKATPGEVVHQTPYVIDQTIWYVVKRQYRFQIDNLYNQLEDVCVSILNLSLVETPSGSPCLGPDLLVASLDEYHSRLFANYYKWCDYLGAEPFPWRNPPWLEGSCAEDCPPTSSPACKEGTNIAAEESDLLCTTQIRQELQQMMFEVATFKLLWAEAANLRHTPELLCWLFHWMCMAWDKDFKPEEDFCDLIRDVIQRIRDEQWYMLTALHTPDHNARLLYDDFNELFWDRRCLELLDRPATDVEVNQKETPSGDAIYLSPPRRSHLNKLITQSRSPPQKRPSIGFSVSRDNLNAVIAELSCSSKPGSGVKTFIEHRTYAQVLRNFWRVLAWHVTTFAGILLLYAVLNEEAMYSVRRQWAIMTLVAILSYGMMPFFDLMLLNIGTFTKSRCWQVIWRWAPVHAIRLLFVLAALVAVGLNGLESPQLQWNGLLSVFYWSFFICHWAHYFLYIRVRDRMPFFIMLWSNKWLAPLSKPSTFTGSVPLLAENFTNVMRYSLFWIFAMIAKALYWLYIILPPIVAASNHVDYVSCRPVYVNSAVVWPGHVSAILQGFIWAPVFLIWLFDLQSWRDEDIIDYAEQEKLEFNELPSISLEFESLSDLHLKCENATVDWRHSAVRYPVFVYCNELTTFLKSCEDFHYQVTGNMLRLCSKKALAKKFFQQHLSRDLSANDPRFEQAMHLQACQEISEALMLYVARYFKEGPQLVRAMEDLWSWVQKDPTRLLWINLQGLKPLSKALQNVFVLAQKASFSLSTDAENLTKANVQLKKALLAMIMLPSSDPEELGGSNIPLVIQGYVRGVSLCFGSHSMIKDIPSILPAPLQRAEVAVMIEQLQISLHHTSLLLLANEGEKRDTSEGEFNRKWEDFVVFDWTSKAGMPAHHTMIELAMIHLPCAALPLLPEELAEMRALHAQLGEANADVVLGDNGSEDARFLIQGQENSKRIASTEYAVKLFFRRAAKILKADDPSFRCAETQRRFGTFINSLLMRIPETPLVRHMVSMMTLTPYYREDTRLDLQDLEKRTDEGVCKMDLLRSLHPVEFDNFIERVDRDRDMFTIRQEIEDRVTDSPERRKLALQDVRAQMQQCGLLHRYDRFCEMLQEWASCRGQVLMRTAYLEETPPEEIHLCRDSNRLDEAQLEIIRSPEGALWREVVNYPPPYEVKQSTRELAQLKYQYVVAAQEFGTDLYAQMPTDGCEPSPSLRAQLLRKVALYKLMVRYPSLRIATLEHERTLDGRPTGHKISVLYRLTADIDPLGERIVAPASANISKLTAAGRFVRQAEGEVNPARIPHLLVPAPRIPVCTPGANMDPGLEAAEIPPHVSSDSPTDLVDERGKKVVQVQEGVFGGVPLDSKGHVRAEFAESLLPSIVAGTRQILGQGLSNLERSSQYLANSSGTHENEGDPFCTPRRQAILEAQSNSRPIPSVQAHKSGEYAGRSSGGGGDFESKISRAIHWLYQKKQCDRSLFAARTRSAIKSASPQRDTSELDSRTDAYSPLHEVAEGPRETLLSLLCQSMPRDPVDNSKDPSGAEVSPLQKTAHSDTLQLAFSATLPTSSVGINKQDREAKFCPAINHGTSPGTDNFRGPTGSYFGNCAGGSCKYDSRCNSSVQHEARRAGLGSTDRLIGPAKRSLHTAKGIASDVASKPTLLEAQFARDLARNHMVPVDLTFSRDLPRAASLPRASCFVEQKSQPWDLKSEVAGSVGEYDQQVSVQTRDQESASRLSEPRRNAQAIPSRRHSIITLHPRQDGALRWTAFMTAESVCGEADRDSDSFPGAPDFLATPRAEAITADSQQPSSGVCPRLPEGLLLHRQEPWHKTECGLSPQAPCTSRSPSGRRDAESEHGSQRLERLRAEEQGGSQQANQSGTAVQRSNSSLRAVQNTGFLSMKERVAFFENRLARHQARVEAEASNLSRQRRNSQQSGMIWPSRRGPLRLEPIYKIRLPLITDECGMPWARMPIIGPGKPENQNQAIAFSRMDTLQVMDMNMESYLEEAIKLRNLLQEFVLNARMRILGFREHIFTENVSSLASYMALQENLFTTTNQRLYFTPLRVRMHYGHPDIFDRYFVQTCGSCSKASNGINLSEDIFAGFNCTARGYSVHHADYIQCGKGRDVGLQQVVMFEKKVAGGNGEQVLSRDLNRLVLNMDFFRVLSLWFTGPGFFLNSVILVLAAYVCLYSKCFLAFAKYNYSGPVESALEYVLTPAAYIQFQLGMLLALPLIPWLFLEKGLGSALRKLVDLITKFAIMYYNFMTCTKASVIDHVLIYGGAKYQETGRGFVIERATLKDIWMFYYFTHFSIGLEIFILLAVYAMELGVPKESWVSWWRGEMEQRCNIVWHHKVIIVLRLLRFPLLAAGIISCVATSIQSADVDCAVYLIAASGLFVTIRALLGDLQAVSPSAKAWLSLILVTGTVALLLWLVVTSKVSLGSIIVSLFSLCLFIHGMLEISFALLGRWAVRSDMFSDVDISPVLWLVHFCASARFVSDNDQYTSSANAYPFQSDIRVHS
ncbi:hypothetical protein cyc_02196 [Cyclospora cayetanensis]|uniref:1,3-beta-glucan synthase n=1 Tax=Cyclospora cayetanensis TaxID=88456 RepID=A0A1D3D8Y6_9EIME|nr:hypothetical protein cyc_02196 [Cyclospora cayetanensis]